MEGGPLMDVTREQLARALTGLELAVDITVPPTTAESSYAAGVVRHPDDVAGLLLAELGARDDGDPELCAVAEVLALLDGIAGAGGAGGVPERALRYVAARYGYVLATGDQARQHDRPADGGN